VLFHFGRLSLVAPLANLLVAPLVAPAMLLTLVALVVGVAIGAGVPAIVFAPLALTGSAGIGAMVEVARMSAGLPFATVDVPPPFNLAAAAASAAALFWVSRRKSPSPAETESRKPESHGPPRPRLVGAFGLAGLAAMLVLVNGSRPDGRLHVTLLDIGQGDAILLQGPMGGRMLIDTGPDPDRLMTLLDQRIPPWDRRLDAVVLTHPHEDHVAGLALLLDRYAITEIVEPGMVGPGPGDAAYRRELAERGRASRVVAAGDRLWLDGIALEVIWPRPGSVPLQAPDSGKEINEVSIVLELHVGVRDMLFTGDVEEEVDPHLLAAGLAARVGPVLDVLKVAHHGSRTATTDALVTALQPRIALISVGSDNDYGHPSPDMLARLESVGARVLRTDLDGTVGISTNGTDLLASTENDRSIPTPPPAGRGGQLADLPPNLQSVRVHPIARRGRGAAARAWRERQAVQPLCRRGRDRGVHRRGHDPPRGDGGCGTGGGGRGPARPRQGAPRS
jgi:competence protein ComEC